MKNETKVKEKTVTKKCSICGGEIVVTIYTDKTYQGGNYFSSLDPNDEKVKEEKDEYWECDKCFNEP